MKYMDRYLDDELEQWMNVIGAVLIVGPKWCGKTTTAEQYAKSVLFILVLVPEFVSMGTFHKFYTFFIFF